MMEITVPIFIAACVVGIFLCLMAIIALRANTRSRAFSQQKRAYDQVDESLDISRHSLELVERSIALTEKLVRNQEEMIRLLREIAGRDGAHVEDVGHGAVQLPDAARPGQHG